MNREDFLDLVNLIRPFAREESYAVRSDTLSLEKKVAMTLYFLKDQGSLRLTANAFGCAKSTLSLVIHEICNILTNNVGPQFIKFPVEMEEVENVVAGFEAKFGFPRVIGCIDGTHVPIKRPSENSQDYFNYKMRHTINVQAVCNDSGHFLDVEVKWPGSVHDARVFANCQIQAGFSTRNYPLYYKELIPGCESVPQLLLGDPAYPLLPYLMKEYASCSSNEEVIFNQMLRAARNQVECAFGRLKGRWRILTRPIDFHIDRVPNIIFSCFVLHNFCERRKIDISRELVQEVLRNERQNQRHVDKIYSYNTTMGSNVRKAITQYFNEYL